MEMGLLMFSLMFLFMFTGIPIGISLGMSTICTMVLQGNVLGFPMIAQRMFTTIDSFPLLAIPYFILAGNLMEYGGISRRLINFIKMLLKRSPAALPTVTTVSSAFFGAISGSNPATVAAIGGIMAPYMIKEGYSKADAGAIIASSGTLGGIIPPSIPMVVYAITASVSVGSMFMGGIIPGILLVFIMCTVHYIKFRNVEKLNYEKTTFREAWHIFLDAIYALIMPLIILGGIYGGIFTPTEAAAVSCIYSFIIGAFVYKELKIPDLVRIFKNTAKTTAIALFVISVAAPFGWLMTSAGIPTLIANGVLSIFSSKYIISAMMLILLIFLGCFIDTQSIILLTTPILVPIMTSLGMSPVALGVFISSLLFQLESYTETMATNLFLPIDMLVLEGMGQFCRSIIPYTDCRKS